jgi:hypothetical protein
MLFYIVKKHHYLYSNVSQRLDKVILPVFLTMVAILFTIVSYIIDVALAQSNFTSSAPSSGGMIQNTPSPRPPNLLRPPAANNQPPGAANNQPPGAANNQPPGAANNQPSATPPITAPPRPIIIAPSNFTASAIISEIEGGNTTISPQTNGSMFLGAPSNTP